MPCPGKIIALASMNRYRLIAITLTVLAGLLLLRSEVFLGDRDVLGQRRKPGTRPTTAARTGRVDYARFSHATKQHQGECKTCHEAPTANWEKVRQFPDVADFPEHSACARCHRQQFFKTAQPIICTDCHTKVSPRDEARFPFRNPAREHQFLTEFPHDRHQDVIASLLSGRSPVFHRASFASPPLVDERKYYNCVVCHIGKAGEVSAPKSGWPDGFAPAADTFKSVPEGHSLCFNCHWNQQAPTRHDCAGCHKLTSPYSPANAPARKTMRFRHEGGGSDKNHVSECTACHINITKFATLRGLKPDVPITSCTECHEKDGQRQDVSRELAAIDKNRNYVCTYCHTSDYGKLDPPPSHYLVAQRPVIKRNDLK